MMNKKDEEMMEYFREVGKLTAEAGEAISDALTSINDRIKEMSNQDREKE